MGEAARAVVDALTRGRRDRVVARDRRRQPRAGEKGGSETGPSPVDRARNGSKHHLLVDATGIPLAWTVTGGNRHDVTQLIPLLDRVPAVAGRPGRPRRRPDTLVADRGYDYDKYRRLLRQRGIKPVIARRRPSTAPDSARPAGSSSVPSPTSTSSNDCSSATNAEPRCTKRCSRSAAAYSATAATEPSFCNEFLEELVR